MYVVTQKQFIFACEFKKDWQIRIYLQKLEHL